ncbi:RND family transporter, partial [Mycobacterium basiliense]
MSDSEAARVGGIFDRLSKFVIQKPFVVIAAWIAIAAIPALLFPPLMEAAAGKNNSAALPDDAPTMVTSREMAKSFEGKSDKDTKDDKNTKNDKGNTGGSQLLVILTNEDGMGPADLAAYTKLVEKLRAEKFSVQDFVSNPPLHEVLASKDNKAWNLPVMFQTGQDDPATQSAYKRIKEIVSDVLKGSTLTPHYAGAVATVADLVTIGQEDTHLIEIGTAVSVLVILLMVYRNIVTMLVPLVTIGLSLATAQGVLSGLSKIGLDVQMQTIVFMTAVMIGAGTDYAVFLISRYHDYVRKGLHSDQAVKNAMMSIGKVIAASAATVAVTFLAMVFSKLAIFASIGPAISISILVAFIAAITLLPAILVLIGRRGWIKPRRDLTHRFWRILGTRIVRRPRIHLLASLIVLAILASSTLLVRFNYDDLKALPEDVDSVAGYDAMDRHFPQNMMTPMMLFIKSPRDLRSPSALADLELMVSRVSQLPNIVAIRGLTRPNGEPLEQTKVSYQAGEVGGKLDEVSSAIEEHGGELDQLASGSNQLADALAAVRDEVTESVANAGALVDLLVTTKKLIGGDKTLNALDQTAKLVGRMRALGSALTSNMVDVSNTVAWASPIVSALNASPQCNADPACVASRSQLKALVDAQTSGSLNSITALGRTLQQTQEFQTVAQTIEKLETNLNQAVTLLRSIDGMQNQLNEMQRGASALAQGSRAIAQGVNELVKQTKRMGSGLDEASDFLLQMKHDANKPSMAGFNIPPEALANDEFKKAAQIFISPDGHGARYLVQSALNPFTTAAMDQVNEILDVARDSKPNSELSDATISMAGIPTGLRDTRDYYNHDIRFIVFATILIVFLILVILLRAIVAPLYLIGSVLVSFLSALGLGVIVFQLILGKDLHWSLPGLSFILLVAVGADYNMLLISRIRDESPHGVRVGVIRTVGSTGGVITSAGLIFAASMFGLLAASIATMVEAGFIIGAGILIDTFLVRSVTVPAMAAMLGQANWWPSKLGATPTRRRVYQRARAPKPNLLDRVKSIRNVKLGTKVATPPTAGKRPLAAAKGSGHLVARAVAKKPRTPVIPPLTISDYNDLEEHSLPLFGSIRLPREVVPIGPPHDDVSDSTDKQHSDDDLAVVALPASDPGEAKPQVLNLADTTEFRVPATNGNG